MGSQRRLGKFVFDSFQSCSWRSRTMSKTQFFQSNKRSCQFEHVLVPAWKTSKFHTVITPQSLISKRLGLRDRVNGNLCNPIHNEARRFYYGDQDNNFQKPWKSGHLKWWLRASVMIGTCCICVIWKTYNILLERVPLHSRTRLILLSQPPITRLSELKFKGNPISKNRTLHDRHPERIRVRKIAQDLFDALQGQREELVTPHFDGLEWEVFVVKGSRDNIGIECGKIILYDWIFEYITSDDEIAFLIAREIGRIVARHAAEIMTLKFCKDNLKAIFKPIGLWDAIRKKYVVPAMAAMKQHDHEGDCIGLYLSALAGYDPRAAPKILEKMDKFWHTRPRRPFHRRCPKLRAKYLSKPEIMEAPLAIYLRGCLNIKT